MSEPFVGVQVGAHSVFDEGADHVLDLLQRTCKANAVLVYSHTYQGFWKGRSPAALAPDHGVPVIDPAGRRLPPVWVTPHHEHYTGTPLRHPDVTGYEFAGRDVLAELIPAARQRGVRVYARMLEGYGAELARLIPGWTDVLAVDVFGRKRQLPCWNHPGYRGFWTGTVEDLFTHYELDGFQWGAERGGPLSNLLVNGLFTGDTPICFCPYCLERARREGVSVDRAREGMTRLYELVSSMGRGQDPADGALVTIFRLMVRYPEILHWERMWYASRDELAASIGGLVRVLRPSAKLGVHVHQQPVAWDPIERASEDYSELARFADWVKPLLYPDIAGPRLRAWGLERMRQSLYRDFPDAEALALNQRLLGVDPASEPGWDELPTTGLSAEHVYRETRRLVAGVAGRCEAYAGVGFDVPWKNERFPSEPEKTYLSARRALEAGADGLVVSREYDEMRVPNLEAIGRAVAEAR